MDNVALREEAQMRLLARIKAWVPGPFRSNVLRLWGLRPSEPDQMVFGNP